MTCHDLGPGGESTDEEYNNETIIKINDHSVPCKIIITITKIEVVNVDKVGMDEVKR